MRWNKRRLHIRISTSTTFIPNTKLCSSASPKFSHVSSVSFIWTLYNVSCLSTINKQQERNCRTEYLMFHEFCCACESEKPFRRNCLLKKLKIYSLLLMYLGSPSLVLKSFDSLFFFFLSLSNLPSSYVFGTLLVISKEQQYQKRVRNNSSWSTSRIYPEYSQYIQNLSLHSKRQVNKCPSDYVKTS